ncbi:MAG: anhydro-N-acetylmuramic acid kinase [Gammaproteobacteria bacterium]|nr:anhydro-N-acetylmuramic acid kinase [Gammaproteobacteria bacterium]
MSDYFVGLISGTSMDGIDAVVVRFGDHSLDVAATCSYSYPESLRTELLAAIRAPLDVELDSDRALHRRVGECFRDAALKVIKRSECGQHELRCIGSHGQTLRHQPDIDEPFSLQIGDADIIAEGTGLPVIANFRQADISAGGQGAPLVPPFHQWLFRSDRHDRVVVNIGGIANITVLPASNELVTGFDTGPGNGLMDAWIRQHRGDPYDANGEWAASGTVDEALLLQMLQDPYFATVAPKSTGFEYFNPAWLARFGLHNLKPADVQATLCELTARTIAADIARAAPNCDEIFICGGGAHNQNLMQRLSQNIPETKVESTATVGLDPDWVEAIAFAWLAMRTQNNETGNLPSVTGASQKVVLGELHSP